MFRIPVLCYFAISLSIERSHAVHLDPKDVMRVRSFGSVLPHLQPHTSAKSSSRRRVWTPPASLEPTDYNRRFYDAEDDTLLLSENGGVEDFQFYFLEYEEGSEERNVKLTPFEPTVAQLSRFIPKRRQLQPTPPPFTPKQSPIPKPERSPMPQHGAQAHSSYDKLNLEPSQYGQSRVGTNRPSGSMATYGHRSETSKQGSYGSSSNGCRDARTDCHLFAQHCGYEKGRGSATRIHLAHLAQFLKAQCCDTCARAPPHLGYSKPAPSRTSSYGAHAHTPGPVHSPHSVQRSYGSSGNTNPSATTYHHSNSMQRYGGGGGTRYP